MESVKQGMCGRGASCESKSGRGMRGSKEEGNGLAKAVGGWAKAGWGVGRGGGHGSI